MGQPHPNVGLGSYASKKCIDLFSTNSCVINKDGVRKYRCADGGHYKCDPEQMMPCLGGSLRAKHLPNITDSPLAIDQEFDFIRSRQQLSLYRKLHNSPTGVIK